MAIIEINNLLKVERIQTEKDNIGLKVYMKDSPDQASFQTFHLSEYELRQMFETLKTRDEMIEKEFPELVSKETKTTTTMTYDFDKFLLCVKEDIERIYDITTQAWDSWTEEESRFLDCFEKRYINVRA